MIGTVKERKPTPRPWIVRPVTNVAKSGANIWLDKGAEEVYESAHSNALLSADDVP